MRTVGAGLLLTGAFSLAIYVSPTIGVVAVALFLASMGNPIYAVANQTALIETADPSSRGTIMATRFGLVQTASVIGAALGGLITRQWGATAAYGVLGVGLLLLALYAIAAGRSTVNPLHGAAYEEATLRRANGHDAQVVRGDRDENGQHEELVGHGVQEFARVPDNGKDLSRPATPTPKPPQR